MCDSKIGLASIKSGFLSSIFQQRLQTWKKIENLQRIYTRNIPEVRNLNYWQRLAHLKIYSQERRMERYRAMYV